MVETIERGCGDVALAAHVRQGDRWVSMAPWPPMTRRKPAHESVPDFVERQIREARDRGDFDGLAGHGRPLEDLGRPDDDLWWVRRKLRDEGVSDLPPALRARRDRDAALAAVAAATSEAEVRRIVGEVNRTIRRINRTTISGPPTATMPLDLDRVLAQWCADRAVHADEQAAAPTQQPAAPDAPRRARRWWHRIRPSVQRRPPPDRG